MSSLAASTGCRSSQLPAANGSLKAAPRLARRALSLKQSQQPGSRKAASQPSAHAVLNNVPCDGLKVRALRTRSARSAGAALVCEATDGAQHQIAGILDALQHQQPTDAARPRQV